MYGNHTARNYIHENDPNSENRDRLGRYERSSRRIWIEQNPILVRIGCRVEPGGVKYRKLRHWLPKTPPNVPRQGTGNTIQGETGEALTSIDAATSLQVACISSMLYCVVMKRREKRLPEFQVWCMIPCKSPSDCRSTGEPTGISTSPLAFTLQQLSYKKTTTTIEGRETTGIGFDDTLQQEVLAQSPVLVRLPACEKRLIAECSTSQTAQPYWSTSGENIKCQRWGELNLCACA